jgi:hypothetical protein
MSRLDSFALVQSVHALESALHSALAECIGIRRGLEDWPDRGSHPADLERITSAAALVAKCSTLLVQFPMRRP